ncbi:hypothetical protein BWZ20_10600 [Winogradskyella sp. J14-2]|uniref:energy transducer TonB n=1 Tax=Winogradskyella sp. J14-2 TaxID=1936080 RepID=UPI000972C8AD|nr:energy transducer TonB [Winogradskyella sp. J14-2]APY08725.1 hypothetical protein BWZ20_10600 [Winogradskyella sp. J14-2]
MKNSKKNLYTAGQSSAEVKKSQKHDANLQKNSTLYFQIGLILCLLTTYGLFEMQFQDKKLEVVFNEPQEIVTIDIVPDFRVEPVKKKPEPKIKPSKTLAYEITPIKDDKPVIETKVLDFEDPIPISDPIDPNAIKTIEKPVDLEPIDFIAVEEVPVYPGCEKKKTNEDKRKCMSDKISKLVSKKFNTNIAGDHGISGLQRIDTQFTVDKNGNVTNIKIRSPHPALEKEAKRVIDKIPSMKPGYQQDKPVGVIYNLPIKFLARN